MRHTVRARHGGHNRNDRKHNPMPSVRVTHAIPTLIRMPIVGQRRFDAVEAQLSF
jgi:hypothetical protein